MKKFEDPRNKNIEMKKTFFQKIFLEKYNFYSDNDYPSIRSTLLTQSKTNK